MVMSMKLVFIGFGTVGQGLAELLLEKQAELKERNGLDWSVVAISDMLKGTVHDPNGLDLKACLDTIMSGGKLSDMDRAVDWDATGTINNVDADVILEATYTDIKTGEPATSFMRAAIERGMNVVTTNKGPIALKYAELAALADSKGVKLLYEGTVMSGTPVLNLLRETLAGSHISEIKGILNGTTNYILSEMEGGMDYEAALKQAQDLGYAEAVPDADVLGWDALAKVTILSNVVFGQNVKPDDIPCEGITGISAMDIQNAREAGKRFKLLGRVWRDGDQVKASVSPIQVEMTHPLAGVMGATNALTITTDTLGDVTISGAGAGRKETGYSMLIDLIALCD